LNKDNQTEIRKCNPPLQCFNPYSYKEVLILYSTVNVGGNQSWTQRKPPLVNRVTPSLSPSLELLISPGFVPGTSEALHHSDSPTCILNLAATRWPSTNRG
jgi:hypothetical protein